MAPPPRRAARRRAPRRATGDDARPILRPAVHAPAHCGRRPLARDFAVTILDGAYLLVASYARGEPPPRDRGAGGAPPPTRRRNRGGRATRRAPPPPPPGAGAGAGARLFRPAAPTHEVGAAAASARASGAAAVARARAELEADTVARRGAGRPNATTTLPGSPTMDTVALHLVRLRDGRVCDRRVYRDDYVRLRRAAAVSVFAETASSCLVSVLSLRWQAFRVLRVSLAPPAPADGAAEPAATSEQAGSDPSRASVRGNAKPSTRKTSSRRLRTRARRWGRRARRTTTRRSPRRTAPSASGGWRRAPTRAFFVRATTTFPTTRSP